MSDTRDTGLLHARLLDSLRARLFLAILAAIVPILGGLSYYVWYQYQSLVSENERAAENLVSMTAAYDQTLINDASDVLHTLSNSPILRQERWGECRGYLASLLGRLPRYLNLGVADANGYQVCSGLPDPDPKGVYLGDREFFKKAIEQAEVTLGGFVVGRMSRLPTVVLAVRVPGDSGINGGVVFGAMNLGHLLAGAVIPDLLPEGRLWVLDRDGRVLQRIPDDAGRQGEQLEPHPSAEAGLTRHSYLDAAGQRWAVLSMTAGHREDPHGLSVRYEVPESALYAEARHALWVGVFFIALLLCVAVLVAWNLMQWATVRDLTEREMLSRGLRERERLISQLMDVTAEAIYGLDATGCCIFANQACAHLLGYDHPDQLVGQHFHTLIHYQHEDGRHYPLEECRMRQALEQGQGVHVDDEVLWRRDGTCFPVEYWSYPILQDGRLEFCLVTFLDISERRAQQRALAYQAAHDPLTGLLNRGEILRRLQACAEQAPEMPWTLVMSNLDGFKEVNVALGHEAGDRLLQAVAQRLSGLLDTSCALARLGSDEFAFLLNTGNEDQARAKVLVLLSALREPFALNELQVRISCSFGLALHPGHARAPDELVRCADTAMRRAKRDGLGIAVFNPQDSVSVHDHLLLRGELRAALAQGQFLLHLQPKIFLNGGAQARGAPMGFEALVRWQHPEQGLIPPGRFIPVIEVSDLIHPFTLWVVDQAVACCVRLQAIHPGVGIAVNVSARNLLDGAFPRQVLDALRRHGLAPGLLELEVTESAIMADPVRALDSLHALHALGVRLSIDDFGTGYSSFAYLHRLPVDALKIDQSFVAGMAADADMRAIVRSIIEMSHTLGLQVIAEGIETRETLDLLWDMGCDVGQGYFIGRPATETSAAAWLRDR